MKDNIKEGSQISMQSDDNHHRMRLWRTTLQVFLRNSKTILKRHGVTTLQYQCMLEIWSSPDQHGVAVGQLAKLLRVRHNTTVTVINALCAKKLGLRVRSLEDRRVVHVQLTLPGRRLLATLVEEHVRELEQIRNDIRKIIA